MCVFCGYKYSNVALHVICRFHSRGHVSIVIAIKCSILLSPQDGDTPLSGASYDGHTDLVRLLLENKADPNISDKVSYSIIPFH